MKKLTKILLLPIVLVLVFFLGPKFPVEMPDHQLNAINLSIETVEAYVDSIESTVKVKPDNQARIHWANDSLKQKTGYVLLYLHGFSASWYEGYPTNTRFAESFGCNAYYSRLASHGIDSDLQLIDMTPYNLYESAKEALQIASVLGEKVIIMGTSTGGSLALQLAADFPDSVHALILLSPNIKINNPAVFLVTGPWGMTITKAVGGGGSHRILAEKSEVEKKYWYDTYRWEGVILLQQLIEVYMKPEVFNKVRQPVFLGYYYKNDEEQDQTVVVAAMLDMYAQLGTPNHLKRKVAFPNAGDHVIGCEETSKSVDKIIEEVNRFAVDILKLQAN